MKKKIEKDSDDFWHRKLTESQILALFDSSPFVQISKFNIFFGYVDSWVKIFLILYPPFKNSKTRIAIL